MKKKRKPGRPKGSFSSTRKRVNWHIEKVSIAKIRKEAKRTGETPGGVVSTIALELP